VLDMQLMAVQNLLVVYSNGGWAWW